MIFRIKSSATGYSLAPNDRHCVSRFADWPGIQGEKEGVGEGNYPSILALAWAYILSARWVDMQQSKLETSVDETSGNGMRYLSTCTDLICDS